MCARKHYHLHYYTIIVTAAIGSTYRGTPRIRWPGIVLISSGRHPNRQPFTQVAAYDDDIIIIVAVRSQASGSRARISIRFFFPSLNSTAVSSNGGNNGKKYCNKRKNNRKKIAPFTPFACRHNILLLKQIRVYFTVNDNIVGNNLIIIIIVTRFLCASCLCRVANGRRGHYYSESFFFLSSPQRSYPRTLSPYAYYVCQ